MEPLPPPIAAAEPALVPPGMAPPLQHWRRRAGSLLRHAAGVARELRQRDELVYGECRGTLVGQGGALRVHYLGRQRFAHDFWSLFDRQQTPPAQTFRTQRNMLQFLLSRSGLQICPPDADLLVVDQFLLPESLVQTPSTFVPFLNAHLPIEADIERQLLRVRSKGHRRKLAAVLKEPPTWRQSHSLRDFDFWYTHMYEPFVRLRFGDDGTVVSRDEMAKTFSKRGYLLLLEEGGQPVSGALMYTSRGRPNSLGYWKYAFLDAASLSANAFGERNAKTEAMVLSHTVGAGFGEIDFGLTRASPTDGIFVHKRRVGCQFRVPEGAAHFALHFAPRAQARLLSRYPMLIHQGRQMQAWVGQDGELDFASRVRLKEALAACAFGGLSQLHLFCTDAAAPPDRLLGLLEGHKAELGCGIEVHSA